MKLLLCMECSDLVAMRMEEKQCFCGKVKGKYLDDGQTIAVDSDDFSKVRIVGIHNGYLNHAVNNDHEHFTLAPETPWGPSDLFIERARPIIMLYPFTTGDVRSYKQLGMKIEEIPKEESDKHLDSIIEDNHELLEKLDDK